MLGPPKPAGMLLGVVLRFPRSGFLPSTKPPLPRITGARPLLLPKLPEKPGGILASGGSGSGSLPTRPAATFSCLLRDAMRTAVGPRREAKTRALPSFPAASGESLSPRGRQPVPRPVQASAPREATFSSSNSGPITPHLGPLGAASAYRKPSQVPRRRGSTFLPLQ